MLCAQISNNLAFLKPTNRRPHRVQLRQDILMAILDIVVTYATPTESTRFMRQRQAVVLIVSACIQRLVRSQHHLRGKESNAR